MGNYDFKRDLAVAKNTEKRVAEILENNYNYEILETNDDNKYDLLLKDNYDKEFTVEIKEDFMCKHTGNVALEFKSRGKLSGINVSESDYYIYAIHRKDDVEYWSFETSALKEAIENNDYFRIVNGGDKGSNTMNYLFKYEEFAKNGVKLI